MQRPEFLYDSQMCEVLWIVTIELEIINKYFSINYFMNYRKENQI